MELQEQDGSTRYFDFLPLSIGQLGDFQIRMHLFTLPVSNLYHSTSSIILRGVDGFVFVADSRVECLIENVEALRRCRKVLQDEGYNLHDLAKVIQYNKRDLQEVLPVALLRQELNPMGEPDMEASATANFGTVECLESIARQIMEKLDKSRKHPASSGPKDRTNHDDLDSLSN